MRRGNHLGESCCRAEIEGGLRFISLRDPPGSRLPRSEATGGEGDPAAKSSAGQSNLRKAAEPPRSEPKANEVTQRAAEPFAEEFPSAAAAPFCEGPFCEAGLEPISQTVDETFASVPPGRAGPLRI